MSSNAQIDIKEIITNQAMMAKKGLSKIGYIIFIRKK